MAGEPEGTAGPDRDVSHKGVRSRLRQEAEEELRSGRLRTRLTLAELIDEYESLPAIPDSAALYQQHLAWLRQEFGAYWVTGVTPQMIAERKAQFAGEIT